MPHRAAMKLKRFLLRYFPPGACPPAGGPAREARRFGRAGAGRIPSLRQFASTHPPAPPAASPAGVILEYERRDGARNTKIIDLLQLTPE